MCCVALRVFVHLLQFTQCAELCLRLQVSKSFIIIIFFFFCFGIVIAKLCVSLDVNTYLVDGNGNSLWLSGCTLSYGG